MEEKEPIIAQLRVLDSIQLEGKYTFLTYTTIGIADGGDFYLKLEFRDLNVDNYRILANLSNLSSSLQISSMLIEKEKYNITHIVITKYNTDNNLNMIWECLSDDPNIYLNFNEK